MTRTFKIFSVSFISLVSLITIIYYGRTLALGDSAISADESLQATTVSPLLLLVVVVLFLTIITALTNALINLFSDTRKLMKFAVYLIGFAIVSGIAAAMGSDNLVYDVENKLIADASTSFQSSVLLNIFYILLFMLIGAIIGMPIYKKLTDLK